MADNQSPLRITLEAELHASPQECFDLMGIHLKEWEQGIQDVAWEDAGEIGPGSKRIVNLNGKTLTEKIIEWNPPHSYSYGFLLDQSEVYFPLEGHVATVIIEKLPDSKSRVIWQQFYNKKFHPMSLIVTWFMKNKFMLPVMRRLAAKTGGRVKA